MPTLADKIAFAERHIRNKEGVQFSLAGRDWVRDQFWLPADGFKLWRRDGSDPCDDCVDAIGEIVESPADNRTSECECGGLSAEPIIVTAINVPRQEGKTFSATGYCLASLFKSKNKSFGLLTASEDQALALYRENYEQSIKQSPALDKRSDLQRMRLVVPSTNGILEALSTAHKSATGRSRTHILIDEARDIEARVVMALIPSVFAMHGIECPRGHVQLSAEQAETAPKNCTACGERLVPWYGRIIITSSSGVLDDSERDWFNELVNDLEANPHPNFHVFRSQTTLNPAKSQKIVGALEDVFGRLESTRHYVAAEMGNQWTRKGEDVVTSGDLARITDKRLQNEEGSGNRAVAFLDTSTADEKTSLVILCDDPRGDYPWHSVYLSHVKWWWPRKMASRVINPKEVESYVRSLLPLYPALEWVDVDVLSGHQGSKAAAADVELVKWPTQMLRRLRDGTGAWRKKLHAWRGQAPEIATGWDALVERILDQTLTLQDVREIKDEFKGVRRDKNLKIVDRDRRKMHADIIAGIACACYRIQTLQHRAAAATLSGMIRKQRSGGSLSRGRPITRGLRGREL